MLRPPGCAAPLPVAAQYGRGTVTDGSPGVPLRSDFLDSRAFPRIYYFQVAHPSGRGRCLTGPIGWIMEFHGLVCPRLTNSCHVPAACQTPWEAKGGVSIEALRFGRITSMFVLP